MGFCAQNAVQLNKSLDGSTACRKDGDEQKKKTKAKEYGYKRSGANDMAGSRWHARADTRRSAECGGTGSHDERVSAANTELAVMDRNGARIRGRRSRADVEEIPGRNTLMDRE